MTAGGNLIHYAGELTTRTADLTTAKIVWNSVLSTPGAKYTCFDISNMYLHTPLAPEDYEYMRIPLKLLPGHIIQQYGQRKKSLEWFCVRRVSTLCIWPSASGSPCEQILES